MKPFVAVNTGAMATELIASELFGHEKGAVTGATAGRRGYLQGQAAKLIVTGLGATMIELPRARLVGREQSRE